MAYGVQGDFVDAHMLFRLGGALYSQQIPNPDHTDDSSVPARIDTFSKPQKFMISEALLKLFNTYSAVEKAHRAQHDLSTDVKVAVESVQNYFRFAFGRIEHMNANKVPPTGRGAAVSIPIRYRFTLDFPLLISLQRIVADRAYRLSTLPRLCAGETGYPA
jgi:hypothetical protein